MGTDCHAVLGRLKRSPNTNKESHFLETANRKQEDFEFTNLYKSNPGVWDRKFDIKRCYALFGWLSGEEGKFFETEPINICDLSKLNAERFIDWLDEGSPTYLDTVTRYGNCDVSIFSNRYIDGNRNVGIFGIDQLLALNYDVVARTKHYSDDDYGPHPELKTYRELIDFQDCHYFAFLAEAKRKDWDFVILSYAD